MKMLFLPVIFIIVVTELSWTGKVSSSPCQVYPSEYAYPQDSVNTGENGSANCRNYPSGLQAGVFTELYIHCDGNQLLLADSDLGPENYRGSDYYVWSTGRDGQLLFIFPTRVSLTTITLHYYSDSVRGLPRLRFYAVPDDFDAWDAPTLGTPHVDVAAVPPDGELAGRRNVSINVNFSTMKVLMYKYASTYLFAVSEVEFFKSEVTTSTTSISAMTDISTSSIQAELDITTKSFTPEKSTSTRDSDNKSIAQAAEGSSTTHEVQRATLSVSPSEVVAWILVSILTVLFTGLLSVNMIMLWLYKKRQARDMEGRERKYEMEGNPCYEATAVKQTTDTHLYEAVRGGGAK